MGEGFPRLTVASCYPPRTAVNLGDRFIRTNEDGTETLCTVYDDGDEATVIDGGTFNPLAGLVTVLASDGSETKGGGGHVSKALLNADALPNYRRA